MAEPLVFDDTAATVVFVATIVGSQAVEWLVTYRERRVTEGDRAASLLGRARVAGATLVEATTTATGADKERDRGTKRILVGSLIVSLVLAALAAQHLTALALPGNGWTWLLLGTIVAWSGIGMRAWAITTLGRFFRRDVSVAPDQHVVTSGPYRYVRHPAYSGNLLVAAGVGLMFGNVVSIVVLVTSAVLGHLPRIRVEQSALDTELGRPYRDFAAERRRLVPGVW